MSKSQGLAFDNNKKITTSDQVHFLVKVACKDY